MLCYAKRYVLEMTNKSKDVVWCGVCVYVSDAEL